MNKRSGIFDNIDLNLMIKFTKFHAENMEIYEQFKKLACQMKIIRKKYSAWSIMNVIRWNYDLNKKETFKINNDFIAIYARLLIFENPQFKGFFELRSMKSDNRRDSADEKYKINKGIYK